MHGVIFAHNGIDHANGIEAAAHQSGSLLWILALTVVTALALYTLKKSRNNPETEEADDEEDY